MSSGIAKASQHCGLVSIHFISESSLQKYNGRPRVHYGKTLACPTNYSDMITALCFCDGAQLTKAFCMYLLQVVPK